MFSGSQNISSLGQSICEFPRGDRETQIKILNIFIPKAEQTF